MKMTNFAKIGLLVLAVLVLANTAFAANGLDLEYVKFGNEMYDANEPVTIELGEELEIKVKVHAGVNLTDVEIFARLVGYEHVDDEKLRTYDVDIIGELIGNSSDFVELSLDVPVRMDKATDYRVSLFARSKSVDYFESVHRLVVKGQDNQIDIRRISFDPAQVIAGRALRTRVKLENIGEEDEDDVYVTVAIPALGAGAKVSADIDELEEDEVLTTEDLLLRIPSCAPAGVYNVEVSVEFNDGYDEVSQTSQIVVLADESCNAQPILPVDSGRTIITPPQGQDVVAGANGVSYPLVISNEGTSDKVYSVSVVGIAGWGSAEITNPTPLVQSGKTEVVYIYVSANENAVAGNQVFEIVVSDGSDSRKVPVSANIVEGSSSLDLKEVLYIGVIVLLALIVILGLVVGFGKARGDNDKEYY